MKGPWDEYVNVDASNVQSSETPALQLQLRTWCAWNGTYRELRRLEATACESNLQHNPDDIL